MFVSKPVHCFTFAILLLSPLFLTAYFFAGFPNPPNRPHIHPSLSSLPASAPSWSLYPVDLYEGGAYVTFPNGRVRYWMIGPEGGKKVVLIHGLSIPSIVWKDVAPVLTAHGYRVLLYDLYGRGYSDAPQMTYDVSLHTTQLALLLQHIRWESTNIVGLSMGGGIATSFSVQFPHLVSGKVALIASAGLLESDDISHTVKFMSSPVIQSVTSLKPFQNYMRRLAMSSETIVSDPISEIVRFQSAHLPGYNAAVASCIRDGPIRGLASAFSSLSESGNDVLIIHGTTDKTVPYKYTSRIQGLVPNSELVTIEGGGHEIAITHADQVTAALLRFLSDDYSHAPENT